jgi:DNA-binding NarL/FixJ family response regulator
LKYALSQVEDIEIAGEAASAADALQILRAHAFDFDLALLDLSLPDKSGLALLADIKREAPQLPVLILSTFPEGEYAPQVLSDGAQGYIGKGTDTETLVRAIRTVANGGCYLSAAMLSEVSRQNRPLQRPAHEQFSSREREIFIHIASGKGLTEIGRLLCLSVKTVSTYRARVLEKTGFTTNSELTRYALQRGLIT